MKRWNIPGMMMLSFVASGLLIVLIGKVWIFLTGKKIDNTLFVGFVLVAVLIPIGAGLVSVSAALRRLR